MSTNTSSQRSLEQASKKLAETHKKEWREKGYITGVHRDWGDDPEDFERKKGRYDITQESWYPTYYLGGGLR